MSEAGNPVTPQVPAHVQSKDAAMALIRDARLAQEGQPPAPAPEPAPEPTPTPEPAPEPVVAVGASSEPAPIPADDNPPAPVDEPGVEEIHAETLADLAEHIGVDASELYKLQLSVDTPDGKVTPTLEEMKDGYRAAQEARIEAQKAAQEREALTAQQAELKRNYEERFQSAAAMQEAARNQLLNQYNSINWAQLEAEDPGEWAVKRQQFNEAAQAMDAQQRELVSKWQAHQAEQEALSAQQREETLGRERQALIRALPEWADAETARTGGLEIVDYLTQQGFTNDETNLVDHRLVLLARKAMLYDKNVKSAEPLKKRVLKIASASAKPGARRTEAQSRADELKSLEAKARKSGRKEDVLAFMKAKAARA